MDSVVNKMSQRYLNGSVVSLEEFENAKTKLPESRKRLLDAENDIHWTGEENELTEIVRLTGQYYDQLYNQLGESELVDLYLTNPDILPKLRPLNQDEQSIKFLKQLAQGKLVILNKESRIPKKIQTKLPIMAIQNSDGELCYAILN